MESSPSEGAGFIVNLETAEEVPMPTLPVL